MRELVAVVGIAILVYAVVVGFGSIGIGMQTAAPAVGEAIAQSVPVQDSGAAQAVPETGSMVWEIKDYDAYLSAHTPVLDMAEMHPDFAANPGSMTIPGFGEVKLNTHAEKHSMDAVIARLAAQSVGDNGRWDCKDGTSYWIVDIWRNGYTLRACFIAMKCANGLAPEFIATELSAYLTDKPISKLLKRDGCGPHNGDMAAAA